MKKILGQVRKWGQEFSKSKHFEELTEEQKQESGFILETFTEYMYSYHGLLPEEWNESELENCCLETLPRKVSADDAYFRSMAPVLSAFFAFSGEKGLLKNASHLAKRVKTITNRLVKSASDPGSWGPAKSFVMAAQDSGVDITNQDEMHRFMALYNQKMLSRPKAEPMRVTPKVGRNEPCPCGSGKKYKKCCGR